MNFAKTVGALIALSVTVSPLIAKDKSKHHDQSDKKSSSAKADDSKTEHSKSDSKSAISLKERELIQTYVNSFEEKGKGKKNKGLPPGLAKKVENGGKLPPGWEKKVSVGEKISVEVLKECKPLPKELVLKLPPPPVGTLTLTIDGKIVRLMEASKVILDVFDLPVPFMSKR
ncbi:MAG: hypothetical protein JWM68_3456 [Verrucomicrobiales bacterium]|nr:hypothetical protein [Verrucomicrobiales bacterium]